MPENKIPLKVFLCYAHSDVDVVRELYYRLTRDGMYVWFDKSSLIPGQEWRVEIPNAIHESDVFIVCHSKQFNQKGYKQKEVKIALEEAELLPKGEIFIIPARLEECSVLDDLQRWHWVDLFAEDGYKNLLRALNLRKEISEQRSKSESPLRQLGHEYNSLSAVILTPSDMQDVSNFINREKEIGLVMNMVSNLEKGKPFSPNERIFHFIGPSGIGKSYLLERFYKELSGKTNCFPLLIRLDTLKGGKNGFTGELLIATYEAFCAQKSIKPKKYNGQTPAQFASHVQRTITSIGKDHIVVLLLDEINVPSQKDIREIEDYLLVNFLHGNNLSILVTAGRSYPSAFIDFALRPNASNIFPLTVFDEEKTGRQIESLKPGSRKLAEKIWKLGSGVPGNTVKLVGHLSGDPPDILNEAQVVQALLDDIKKTNKIENRFYPMLEAISILHGFFPEDVAPLFQCHPQLSDEWEESEIKEEFLELNRIQIGPSSLVNWDREKKHWAMDESTRDLFEKELQMRDPELWKKLHCTALGMYQEWGQKYSSDLYRGKSNYHEQRLQSAGLNCNDLEG